MATALEIGELENGSVYLIYPPRDGVSFRDLLRYRVSITSALLLAFRQACSGVAHAHSKGIVHRNLKPANIRIQNGGRVVVTGWWLASSNGEEVARGDQVLGTPAYMAPELLEGETVTPRADVYSLGVILFEVFTGITPTRRHGDDVVTRDPNDLWAAAQGGGAVSRAQSNPKPAQSEPAQSTPNDNELFDDLDRVIQTCLDPDPDKRYDDARALLDAIEDIL